jgi:hypothetical protein
MKQFGYVCLFACWFLLMQRESFGDITPSKMSSTTQPTSKIPEMEKYEPTKKAPPKPPTLPTPLKPPPQVRQRAEYLHPGILVYLNGKWEGSDHLLNLSNNIGVYVTIVRPEDKDLAISEEQLHQEVEKIFRQVNINPVSIVPQGQPPLPAFEIEIFLYPIEMGYVACCNGRLFESVKVGRFQMDPNMAFQAITWEKQTLIVGPTAKFAEQLTQNVQNIAATFAERFQTYEMIKRQTLR